MTNPWFDRPDLDIVQAYQQEIPKAQELIQLKDYAKIPCTLMVWLNNLASVAFARTTIHVSEKQACLAWP